MTHQARRGDEIEAYIKRWRDKKSTHDTWNGFDDMLDDYRLHADTGTPLDQDVSND